MSAQMTPEERRATLEAEMQEAITLDALTGDWKLLQRRHGHRYSTDDLLTAWYACAHYPDRTPALDLGTGIGSVGLSYAWKFPAAQVTGLEAQAVSYRLLRENVAMNGSRMTIVHGDLREVPAGTFAQIPARHFAIVTGSPPYFDAKKAVMSEDSQKAHARFELRGDVRDYCRAARYAMTPGARFVFCFPTPQIERAIAACAQNGLCVERRRDVIPRAGRDALFSLFGCREDDAKAGVTELYEPPLVVRDAVGQRTDEMQQIRVYLGMPIP
jgi:tRNA1(Val) A37 N6-methylase TrmN6